jgi:outer membrane protease
MKSIYAFILFVTILVSSYGEAYDQETIDFTILKTPYRISLTADAGVLLGQAEEIVYRDSDTDGYLSQLLWDLKPLVYIGPSLSLSRADPLAGLGGTADLSIKFGLPILSGTMEDRDWTDPSDPDLRTNFSSHNAYIQGAMLLDVSGGITIPIKSAVVLKGLASFSFMRFSWIAQNGYRKYIGDEYAEIAMQGTGISYDQNWMIFSPGIGLFWPVYRALSMDVRFFISPLLFAWDRDIHVITKTQYSDTMLWGLYLDPVLDFSFTPNRYLSVTVHGSWRYITGARGDILKTAIGDSDGIATISSNQAGASYNAFDVGLSFRFALPLGSLSKKN